MRGFHWEGTYPSVITNSNGEIVLVSQAVIDCPGAEYFFQWIYRKSESAHICLLCPRGSPVSVFSTQMNKTSNIITHIKLMHKENISAYQHIHDSVKSRVEKEWDFRLNNPDAPVKNTAQVAEIAPRRLRQQTTLTQFQSLPVAKQKNIWMRAVVLGGLPYNLKGNLGLNYAISQYNGGTFPKGLSRSMLTRDISELYQKKLDEKNN